MTTLYPRATWREVTDERSDPSIIPVGAILHVSGGEAESLFGYFDGPSGGIESHLHIAREPKEKGGGGIEQYRDLDNEADANYHGNRWVASDGKSYGYHSVETQGTANGPWGAYQFEEIAQFLAWDSQKYGYPLRLCKHPKDPGVGWHVMWGAPGEWTPARGKVCPGPDRIKQVPAVIARAQQIVNGQLEDDMYETGDRTRDMTILAKVEATFNRAAAAQVAAEAALAAAQALEEKLLNPAPVIAVRGEGLTAVYLLENMYHLDGPQYNALKSAGLLDLRIVEPAAIDALLAANPN